MFPWLRGGGAAGGEGPAAQTVVYLCPSDTTQFDFPHKRSNNISVTVNYAAQKPIKGPSASTQPLLCGSACAQISRIASQSLHPCSSPFTGPRGPLQRLPRESPSLHTRPDLPTKITAKTSYKAASLPVPHKPHLPVLLEEMGSKEDKGAYGACCCGTATETRLTCHVLVDRLLCLKWNCKLPTVFVE